MIFSLSIWYRYDLVSSLSFVGKVDKYLLSEHPLYSETFLEDEGDEELREGDDLDYTPVTVSDDSSSFSCPDDSVLSDQAAIPQTVFNHNYTSTGQH